MWGDLVDVEEDVGADVGSGPSPGEIRGWRHVGQDRGAGRVGMGGRRGGYPFQWCERVVMGKVYDVRVMVVDVVARQGRTWTKGQSVLHGLVA